MKPKHLLMLVAVGSFPISVTSPSLAAATLSTDNGTTIGSMTTPKYYGPSYSGFWRSTAPDYTLLTNGADTYVNAPASNAAIHFRANNAGANGYPDIMTIYGGGEVAINDGLLVATNDSYAISVVAAPNGVGITSQGAIGVQGVGTTTTAFGVEGIANTGVVGYALTSGSTGNGVEGHCQNTIASGVYGENLTGSGYGVAGRASYNGTAVYGDNASTGGWAGYFNGYLNVTANASKPGGGLWTSSSDAAVKKNVKNYTLGLEAIEKVRPVTFQYNGLGGTSDDGREYVGVIAQELEKIAPAMVTTKKMKLHGDDAAETDIRQVDGSAFTYMLIKAVQEQQQIIQKQDTRIQSLERSRAGTLASSFFGSWGGMAAIPLAIFLGIRRRRAS